MIQISSILLEQRNYFDIYCLLITNNKIVVYLQAEPDILDQIRS